MAISRKLALASAALVLAVASAAFGTRAVSRPHDPRPLTDGAPRAIEPFALAALLAEAPPDVVVITLDEARHPLRGAQPLAAFGGSEDALVASAPKGRRIVLAASDVVRQDRVARRLAATGRDVSVLASGLGAWDRAMDADPPPPQGGASEARGARSAERAEGFFGGVGGGAPDREARWQTYRSQVALRRSFGDAAPAAVAPVAVPIAPAAAGAGGAPKKREGC